MPTNVQADGNGSSWFLLICCKDMEFLVLLHPTTSPFGELLCFLLTTLQVTMFIIP